MIYDVVIRWKENGNTERVKIATDMSEDNEDIFFIGNPFYISKKEDFDVLIVKTYRYIYPLCKHFRSVFKEQPYPAYDKGYVAGDWKRDRETIRQRCVKMLAELDLDAYIKPAPRVGAPKSGQQAESTPPLAESPEMLNNAA